MARRTISVDKIQEIIRYGVTTELREPAIGRALKVSRAAVTKYLEWFRGSGLTWDQAQELPDNELLAVLEGSRPARTSARTATAATWDSTTGLLDRQPRRQADRRIGRRTRGCHAGRAGDDAMCSAPCASRRRAWPWVRPRAPRPPWFPPAPASPQRTCPRCVNACATRAPSSTSTQPGTTTPDPPARAHLRRPSPPVNGRNGTGISQPPRRPPVADYSISPKLRNWPRPRRGAVGRRRPASARGSRRSRRSRSTASGPASAAGRSAGRWASAAPPCSSTLTARPGQIRLGTRRGSRMR